jgi:hypothetical protein
VDEETEHTNRLTSHLKIYFPQMLTGLTTWTQNWCELSWCAGRRWKSCKKVSPTELQSFSGKHHCRNHELILLRILAIRQSIPAIRDRAVSEATGDRRAGRGTRPMANRVEATPRKHRQPPGD